MSETTPSSEEIRRNEAATRDLAKKEKRAARTLTLGRQFWALVTALALYVAYLVLPHAGGVPGFQVLLQLSAAEEAGIKVTEYIYSILLFLGLGLFTTLTLITRLTTFALIAWMFSTVALIYSLFALWLRFTRPVSEADVSTGIGLWISILGVLLAVVTYSMVALRRDDHQKQAAQQRAEHGNLDEVGFAQRAAMVTRQNTSYEDNPLFVDDRRRQAAQRNRKNRERSGD